MFGKRGEAVLKYLAKGQLVGVSGEATLRKYTNKSGVEGSSLDVRVNDLTLLGGKADRPEQTVAEASPNNKSRVRCFRRRAVLMPARICRNCIHAVVGNTKGDTKG